MKLYLLLLIATLGFLTFSPAKAEAATPGFPFAGGYYTNLCGGQSSLDGNGVDAYRCQAECNPSTGVCRAAERSTNPPETKFAYVIKYICTGKTTNCDNTNAAGRVIYEQYSTEYSINSDPSVSCGQTAQLDVFDSNNVLKGFMTWYAGDCAAPTATPTVPPAPTPTNSPTATPTHTPTPTNAPTATPTPTSIVTNTPTPTPTIVPQGTSNVECPAGTLYGGIQNSTIICVSQNQVQNQNQWVNANSNAETGPVYVNLSTTNPQVVEVPRIITVAGASVSKELPKTGLPLAAWGLSGLLPIGAGLRKFGKNTKAQENSANFIWQTREFLKDN